MEIYYTISSLKEKISEEKKLGATIGLVPTMGALHEGHLSLLKESKKKTQLSIVSIFVNPTQFNDENDYLKYPSDLDADTSKLEKNSCDIIFIPEVKEIYPEPDNRKFNFGHLDKIMEGKFRPGHFEGVAKVVTKFFDIVKPDYAFFGEKDFQQLTIIKKIVEIYKYNITIVGCPILREKDGLAMSSRNLRLSPQSRKEAAVIYQTLKSAKKLRFKCNVQEIKEWVSNKIANTNLTLEYFEVVDSNNLQEIKEWDKNSNITACIAAWIEGVRLIDNMNYNL